MDKQLDLSIRIWSDFYNRVSNTGQGLKLLKEANELCQCFGIPENISNKGRRIAIERAGDKNVHSKK